MFATEDPSSNQVWIYAIGTMLAVAYVVKDIFQMVITYKTKREISEVKTSQIVSSQTTSGKLEEVKAALAENTNLTVAAATVVSDASDRQASIEQHVRALQTHSEALQTLMMVHGIECPPHPTKKD